MWLSLVLPHSELSNLFTAMSLHDSVQFPLQSPLVGRQSTGNLVFPQMWPSTTEIFSVCQEQRLCLFGALCLTSTRGSRTHWTLSGKLTVLYEVPIFMEIANVRENKFYYES